MNALTKISSTVLLSLVLMACNSGNSNDAGKSQSNPLNEPPIADAGPHQTVEEGSPVTLTATASDNDGAIATYEWRQVSGPTVSLQNASSGMSSFTAPEVSIDTVLEFELIVTDNDGARASDSVSINIQATQDNISISIQAPKSITAGSWAQVKANVESKVDITQLNWDTDNNVDIQVNEQAPEIAILRIPNSFTKPHISVSVTAENINGTINTQSIHIDLAKEKTFEEYTEDLDALPLEDITITPTISENSSLTPANRIDNGYTTFIASADTGILFEPRLGSLRLIGSTPDDVQVGDIIVGLTEDESQGFMRRVLNISDDTYITEIATLSDAFPNADLTLNLLVSNKTAQSRVQVAPRNTDLPVAKYNDINILNFNRRLAHKLSPEITSVVNLEMNSALEVDFDISIFRAKIERIATIAKANYKTDAHVSLVFEQEKELFDAEKKFNPIVDKNFKIFISGIPVLVNLKLIPEIEAAAGVSGAVNMRYGISASGEYRSGFEYSDEKLNVINSFNPVTSKIGPSYTLSGAMTATTETDLEVVLSFYETTIPIPGDDIEIDGPGIGLDIGPYAEFIATAELDVIEQSLNCDLALDIGLAAEAELDFGVVGEILNLSPEDKTKTFPLFNHKSNVWKNSEVCDFITEFGHIAGSVRSSDGDDLPNANINIRGLDNGENQAVSTDASGLFQLSNLPAGNYEVSISQGGFRTEQLTVNIRDQETSEIDAVLLARQPGDPGNETDPVPATDEQGNQLKSAKVTGDPSLRTFDGLFYGFHGVGEYIMAQSSIDDFAIQGRFLAVNGSDSVSLNTAVAANLEGTRVTLYRAETGLALLLDGQLTEWGDGSYLLNNGASIKISNQTYTLYWADRSSARIYRRGQFVEAEVTLNNQRAGSINGVLGFFDGRSDNELTTAAGISLSPAEISNFNQLYDVYGESWRVTKENTLFDYFDNQYLENFVDRNFPRSLITQERLQQQLGEAEYQRIVELCQRYVTQTSRLNACVIDVALTGEKSGLSAYSSIAHPVQELDLPVPPALQFSSPASGAILNSNVLISGKIDTEASIELLTLSINGQPAEDISFALSGNSFQLTQSANQFLEGQNTLIVFATDINGNRGNTSQGFIFDSSVAPPAGGDVIVINDVNMFDRARIDSADNIRFSENLVSFSIDSPRSAGTSIWWDLSHAPRCDESCRRKQDFSKLEETWAALGYNLQDIHEAEALKNIPTEVKLIILWTPMQSYSKLEIESLKAFAAEGGRILFIGENEEYYQASGIEVENNFLHSMGALMRNIGEAHYGGNTSFVVDSDNQHQIVENVTSVQGNYVSLLELGPNDYPLLLSNNGQDVIAAVARVDINIQPQQKIEGKRLQRLQLNEVAELQSKNPPSPIIFNNPAQN